MVCNIHIDHAEACLIDFKAWMHSILRNVDASATSGAGCTAARGVHGLN